MWLGEYIIFPKSLLGKEKVGKHTLVHNTFLKFHFWNPECGNHWSKWVFDSETFREFSCNSFYHKNLTNLTKDANVKAVMAGTQVTGVQLFVWLMVSLLVKREITSGENGRSYTKWSGYFLHLSVLHAIGDLIGEGLEEKIWVHLEVLARSWRDFSIICAFLVTVS